MRPGRAHLMGVNRDFSQRDPVPPGTWMLAFGWHMHSLFDVGYDFPYHPNVVPVFVSFHLNRAALLTPEAIEYLRRHGPIGCRDWGTVDILLSEGIDAFFTGCLTSTVNAVFPDRDPSAKPKTVGLIDVKPGVVKQAPEPKEVLSHAGQQFREAVPDRGGDGGHRAAGALPDRLRPHRHQPAALLPPGHLARHPREVRPGQPLRHPLRGPARHGSGCGGLHHDAGSDPGDPGRDLDPDRGRRRRADGPGSLARDHRAGRRAGARAS